MSIWHCDFVWGFQGVGRAILPQGLLFRDTDGKADDETPKDLGFKITGKLHGKSSRFWSGEFETKHGFPRSQVTAID
jgi:hypothetical protein